MSLLVYQVDSRRRTHRHSRHPFRVEHRLGDLPTNHQAFHPIFLLQHRVRPLAQILQVNLVVSRLANLVASRRGVQLVNQPVCLLASPRIYRAVSQVVCQVQHRHRVQLVCRLQFRRINHRVSRPPSRRQTQVALQRGGLLQNRRVDQLGGPAANLAVNQVELRLTNQRLGRLGTPPARRHKSLLLNRVVAPVTNQQVFLLLFRLANHLALRLRDRPVRHPVRQLGSRQPNQHVFRLVVRALSLV